MLRRMRRKFPPFKNMMCNHVAERFSIVAVYNAYSAPTHVFCVREWLLLRPLRSRKGLPLVYFKRREKTETFPKKPSPCVRVDRCSSSTHVVHVSCTAAFAEFY